MSGLLHPCVRCLLGAWVFFGLAAPAAAETLVVGLSNNDLQITSNFTGDSITLFGTIERDAATVARRGAYDVVVVVRGPRDGITAREKTRVAGIWLNTQSRTFYQAPIYYAMLSTRPIQEIATPEVLQSHGIGARNGVLRQAAAVRDERTDVFLNALVRLQKQNGLFYDQPGAVEFLSNNLFVATIPIPATVPVGAFTAEVHLFSGGAQLTVEEAVFIVDKTGFEQFVYLLANQRPFLYGVASVLLAFLTGWLGGVVFRRD